VETAPAAARCAAWPPPATPGNTLNLSIDIKLQALVEQLFGDRRGALVAIDPRNGEVLAFVSKPTFDPNLFVDGIDPRAGASSTSHRQAAAQPRAARHLPAGLHLQALMAMAALTTGKRTPSLVIQDNLSYTFGGHTFGSPRATAPAPRTCGWPSSPRPTSTSTAWPTRWAWT
jgi:penicillin-binding protein 2